MPTHITIADNADPRDLYAIGATPTSVFPITFAFFNLGDVKVIKTVAGVDTQLILGADYSVTPDTTFDGGYIGGSLTLSVPVTNCNLTVYYDAPFQRLDDLPNTGPFDIRTLNTTLDRYMTLLQQLRAAIRRIPILSITTAGDLLDLIFPPPIPYALIGWDPTGTHLVDYLPEQIVAGGISLTFLNDVLLTGQAPYQMVRFNAALKLVNENAPYALGFSTDDGLTYGNGQVILRHAPVLPFVLKAGLSGARAGCVVAPTGSIAVAIKKNGSSVGTINIAAGATTATFTFASDVSFTTSDTLTITAPASADITLAGVFANLPGIRQ